VPVRDLSGETANSWEYCRQLINPVEPLFVCILGQRYTWVLEPQQIRDQADRQVYGTFSITEMETQHAVFSNPSEGCDRTSESVLRMERTTA